MKDIGTRPGWGQHTIHNILNNSFVEFGQNPKQTGWAKQEEWAIKELEDGIGNRELSKGE